MNDTPDNTRNTRDATGSPRGEAPLLVIDELHKSYRMGRTTLEVLRGVSLRVRRGEFVAVVGASGSGKSTLLHMAGLLDRPTSGAIAFDGLDVVRMSAARRARLRSRRSGFVFQFFHLLAELNVLENVLIAAMTDIPLLRWPARRAAVRGEAVEVLEELGLGERLRHKPMELSGGERQRVAIARALINKPDLLLADEPTGNLDSHTGGRILDLLEKLNRQRGQTIVMVTHDMELARRAGRILRLSDGRFENAPHAS